MFLSPLSENRDAEQETIRRLVVSDRQRFILLC